MPYLNYIKEHRRIFKTAVKQASVLRMDDAYHDLNIHILMQILERFQVSATDQRYVMRFYISGIMAIIDEWLKNDCKDNIEYIISVIQQCIKQPQQ